MKKVVRMRMSPTNMNEETSGSPNASTPSNLNNEPIVRTTGRIKKPKAVFDPSDSYLPRAQRLLNTPTTGLQHHYKASSSLERRASTTKSSNISPVGSIESKDACFFCKKKESKRPLFASKNPIISCSACERKVHKLCLNVDFEDFESLLRSYKCDQCSNCRICNATFNNPEEEMIICSKCTNCFHITCIPTKIINTDNLRNWKCKMCQVYNQATNGTTLPVTKIREIIGGVEPVAQTTSNKIATLTVEKNSVDTNLKNDNTSSTTTNLKRPLEVGDIRSSPPIAKHAKLSNQSSASVETNSVNTTLNPDSTNLCFSPNETFDDMPDVKDWSIDQVYEYFFKHFPKEAHVFKEEEIDGRCLLLLKRSDVVRKLPIKLGPSLHIYNVILKMQAQLSDAALGWNC